MRFLHSNPENVIVVCLKSDNPEGIDITLDFTSEHPTAVQKSKDDRLIVQGKAPGYVERRTFEQMENWGDQHKHPELYDEKGNRKFDKRVLYGDEIDNKGMLFEAQLKPILPSRGNLRNHRFRHTYQSNRRSVFCHESGYEL